MSMHEVARTVSVMVRRMVVEPESPDRHERILREAAERLEAVLEEVLPERLARYLARAAVAQACDGLARDECLWDIDREMEELLPGALADLVNVGADEDPDVRHAVMTGDAVRALRRLLS